MSTQTDPVTRLNLQIRGVLIEIASKLQALVSQSNNMALNKKELSFDDNSDEVDGYFVNTVDEYSITDEVHGEKIKNNF